MNKYFAAEAWKTTTRCFRPSMACVLFAALLLFPGVMASAEQTPAFFLQIGLGDDLQTAQQTLRRLQDAPLDKELKSQARIVLRAGGEYAVCLGRFEERDEAAKASAFLKKQRDLPFIIAYGMDGQIVAQAELASGKGAAPGADVLESTVVNAGAETTKSGPTDAALVKSDETASFGVSTANAAQVQDTAKPASKTKPAQSPEGREKTTVAPPSAPTAAVESPAAYGDAAQPKRVDAPLENTPSPSAQLRAPEKASPFKIASLVAEFTKFASDWWRYVVGAVLALLTLLLVRSFLRRSGSVGSKVAAGAPLSLKNGGNGINENDAEPKLWMLTPERYMGVLKSLRQLKHALQGNMKESNSKLFVFAAAHWGAGASSMTFNLGLVLGHDMADQKILLVDTNLAKPSMSGYFDLPSGPGLQEYILQGLSLDAVTQRSPLNNVDLITAGKRDQRLACLIDLKRMDTFVEEVRERYDIVLFDGGCPLFSVESRRLSMKGDAIFVVVEAHKTRREALLELTRQMQVDGVNVIGGILNMRQFVIPKWVYKFI